MDAFFSTICENANHAHWIIFLLLLLTGLNIPISEDLLLLGAGAIAASCIPEHTLRMYIWVYFGCIFSAWEAYWLGRILGPRLYHIPLFKSFITPHRLELLRQYYVRFGSFTFIVGRFCPGGVRNALFVSSGLTTMPFYLFILRDGCACLLSSSILFYLGYRFGQNFDLLMLHFHHYTDEAFAVLSILILVGTLFWWIRRKQAF